LAKTQENITRLTLVKGKVAMYNIENKNEKLILLPGQQGIFNESSGKFSKETFKNLNMLAWRTGRLQFNNAPLSELCRVLSSFYKTKIIYVKKTMPSEVELFTGSFNNIPLEKSLDIINMTLNVNIKRKGDCILIYYK
jgi:transmembrane sensor